MIQTTADYKTEPPMRNKNHNRDLPEMKQTECFIPIRVEGRCWETLIHPTPIVPFQTMMKKDNEGERLRGSDKRSETAESLYPTLILSVPHQT